MADNCHVSSGRMTARTYSTERILSRFHEWGRCAETQMSSLGHLSAGPRSASIISQREFNDPDVSPPRY